MKNNGNSFLPENISRDSYFLLSYTSIVYLNLLVDYYYAPICYDLSGNNREKYCVLKA